MKPLGLSGRKNPVQTVLILLLESGLAFLGFQVSHFYISPLVDMCTQDTQCVRRSEGGGLDCAWARWGKQFKSRFESCRRRSRICFT